MTDHRSLCCAECGGPVGRGRLVLVTACGEAVQRTYLVCRHVGEPLRLMPPHVWSDEDLLRLLAEGESDPDWARVGRDLGVPAAVAMAAYARLLVEAS